ncbi:SpaA isopeptide-forming pilin-related protein [Erysipelatoclostridium ramosum]|uniref:SpaA isopeptide-forming pilin-related protein n=4 Tax=Thomasclavelia ramosa TaxID=1547 RepID=UPI002330F3AE|nr:SpaA isopeptide-forming pilin-related protein [Thomasclavelia ramosa]MDB7092607.1 SpaA isopeptide-forming pilin-related protein [Thomasclavelia ramosa]
MKKISTFLLSVLVLFGMAVNDMSFVSAMNTEKVTLTSEKEEIETDEKTNLKAHADLPKTAEVIDYKWTSDNEEIAIVSGEMNSAVVEAKAAGKAKITVTVNYRNKVSAEAQENINSSTAEIEINVVERKPQDIVTAKEESDAEASENNLDPVTAEYIKNNLDTAYTSLNMMRLDQVLVVKNTLVEAEGIAENETIDSFFLREDTGDLFITTIPSTVALYNLDINSNYYVGLGNTMLNDSTAEVKDQIFAINNNNAEVVNDRCHYDAETGLVYISKDLFGNTAGNVQVQFLQAVSQSTAKLSSEVNYTTTDSRTVKEGSRNVDSFDFETNVKTEKDLDKTELTVSVNGLPTSNYSYDSESGVITIPQSSTAVQSVNVDVDKKSPIAKLADKFLNITNVEAFSMGEMGCAGTVDVPDGVGIGWSGQISLYKAYASDWKNATLPVYGLTTGERDLMNTIYYGGQLDYNKLYYQNTAMYLGIWIQGGVDTTTGIWHNSFWNWTAENVTGATQLDAWLRLQCTHLSNPDTGKGVEWKDELINVRVLDKTGDEIVVGFLTKRVNSQSGAGIAKFKIKPKKGDLNITKVNGNPELTAGNDCYSLAGAEYQLRDGSGNTVATLITDVNGNASVSGINAGNYTLVETKASPGFELNTEHTSVTINAGQTTTLNGVGCLVEQPANDPVAIQITKMDADNSESASQGNASLEGAEFTVKYYNDLYDKVSDLPEKATRTWVLKTIRNTAGDSVARLGDKYLVNEKSDELFKIDGFTTLPIGTMTIQETKAPDGYLLEGATLIDSTGSSESIDNGVYLTQIKQNGNTTSVVAGNFPIVKDEVKKHHIEIEKVALDQEGNKTPLNGAEFSIKLKSEVEEKGWDSAEAYDVVTTANIDGKDGQAVTKDLPFGTYIARETVTPAGYVQAEDFEFTIDKDVSETAKVQHFTVTDVETHIRLYKYDIETQAPLRNAEYLIFNETTNQEVGRYKTNDEGIIDLYKLAGGNSYYAQEVTAPNGYEINDTKFYFDIDSNGFVKISDKNSDENKKVFTINDKGDMTISLSNKLKWFKLNVVKKNDADKLLAGAEFTLYKNADCTDEVMSGITDDNGNLLFEKVEVGTYWIKETKAPAGYRKLLDPIKVVFKCIDGKHVFVVNDVVIDENNSNENYSMTLENDWYIGNMTVINERGAKLPATGSKGTVLLVGSGIVLCLIGLNKKKKNKGEA